MTTPSPSIRDTLLSIVVQAARDQPGNLQQTMILKAAASQLLPQYKNQEIEQAILTQWGELFRTGLLAWGLNLNNPNQPFFHLTEVGRKALANATRDPSNPAGYLKHLDERAVIGPIARSYLIEGLDCYVAGLYKAAAIMVGGASESIILDLRDSVVAKLSTTATAIPRALADWRIRTVTTALAQVFDSKIDPKNDRELREEFEAYWTAFSAQIRFARNDVGHPSSVDPVTTDTVHASLLIFPELARLATSLTRWVGVSGLR